MAKNELNSDQIRQLENNVHLAGIVAELGDMATGTTNDGVPYLAFRGSVQCGDDAIYTVPFRVFVKSKKKDGTDSKLFANVKDWYNKAIPLTKDTENATKVDMRGSLVDNPYVSQQGELVPSTQFNMQLFGNFKDYAAEITLEGCIIGVTDEVISDTPTGRGKIRFFTRDIFHNNMELTNIIVQSEDVNDEVNKRTLEDAGYIKGATTTISIDLLPSKAPAPVKKGGIGKQHTTDGTNRLEWVLIGADDICEGDKALSGKLVKAALSERTARLDEIKRAGYLGNKGTSSHSSGLGSKKGGVTKDIDDFDVEGEATAGSASDLSPVEDDDDFPF